MNQPLKALSCRHWLIGSATLLILGALFIAIVPVDAWDFRNNLWGPARLITQGQSAYTIRTLGFDSEAVWMPTAVGAFFWLGYAPLTPAASFWWFFNALLLLAILAAVLPPHKPPPLLLAPWLVAVALFPPLIVHFNLGQYTLWATALLILCAHLLEARRYGWLGVLIALASGKPQLLFLPLVGLLSALYQRGGRDGLRSALVGLTATVVVLTLPLWLSAIQWPTDFLTALRKNQVWEHPSSLQVLTKTLAASGLVAYLLLCLFVAWIATRLWRRLPALEAMLWTMALNLIVAPYIWTWDAVALLPLWTYYLFRLNRKAQRALLLLYALIWGGMLHVQVNLGGNSYLLWWMPWAFIGGLAVIVAAPMKKG